MIYAHWQAVSGQAVDRHLLGLRMLALEAGMEVPELYKDMAYVRSLHFCLSTSQVHKTYIHTYIHAYIHTYIYTYILLHSSVGTGL